MILDYTLATEADERDLRTADEITLRYHRFRGDIIMRIGDIDLSTHLGWVPVLDFAAALRYIATALEREPQQVFQFTESDATIDFTRDGDVVSIRASYASEVAEVPYEAFSDAANRFLARVVGDLTAAHPELADNPFVVKLAAGA